MFPVRVESVRFAAELADEHGSVEVYRRGGDDDDELDRRHRREGARRQHLHRYPRDCDMQLWSQVRPGDSRDDPRTLAHAIEWQPWDEHADAQQAPDSVMHARGLGRSQRRPHSARSARRRRLRARRRRRGAVCPLRCRSGPGDAAETDIDCAVRLSAEVADLVRRLAERDDDHPATLWIVTRGVRDGSLRRGGAPELSVGTGRGHQGRAATAVGRPGGHPGWPDRADIGDCASALSAVLRTPAKSILALRDGEFLAPALAPVVRRTGARAVAVSPRCGISHHRRHGRPRSTDGRLARGPRCTSSGTRRAYAVAAQARLGQRHQRRGRAPQDRRHPGTGDAGRHRRCRGPRRRIARRGAGSARQAGRRRGAPDTRCHTRRRSHRRPAPDRDCG